MRKALLFVAALAALLAISVAAQAHSEEAHSVWLEDWNQRLEVALAEYGVLPVGLMEERHDWLDRHPCSRELGTWTDAECAPAPSAPATSTNRTSPPSPPSGSTGMGTNVEQWRGLVASYFGSATDQALRVMACESGGNPNAYNPSGASGLFQMMPIWHRTYGGDPFNPADNVRMAYSLYRDSGYSWSHWVCRP